MKIKRGIQAIFLTAIFLLLNACQPRSETKLNLKTIPTLVGHDVTMLFSDSGATQMRIKMPLRETFTIDTSYTLMKKGFFAELVSGDSVRTTITAKWGAYINAQRLLEMKDDVVVKNNKNEILRTDYLIWDEAHAQIYTHAPVEIQKENQVIFGDTLIAKQDFSQYKIIKPKGIIHAKNP